MKTLALLTVLAFAVSAQMPTGTATPVAVVDVIDINISRTPRRDPTRNVVCDYFVANWGKANWPGTSARPWSYQIYHRKRLQRGKWVCDVSRGLEEVNGP